MPVEVLVAVVDVEVVVVAVVDVEVLVDVVVVVGAPPSPPAPDDALGIESLRLVREQADAAASARVEVTRTRRARMGHPTRATSERKGSAGRERGR